jgi:hypothetical protein
VLVVTAIFAIRAGTATGAAVSSGQDLSGCVQGQLASASPVDSAATDWVARHAASLTAGKAVDLSNCFQPQPASAIPADRGAAPDWVARHAASLNAGNVADLSN